MNFHRLAPFLLLLLAPGTVFSQNSPAKPLQFSGYAITDSLEYSAKTINYEYDKKKAVLVKNAIVKYFGRILKSSHITYFQDHQYVVAEGEKDSTGTLIGNPVFTDTGGEELKGLKVEFNMKSEQGLVVKGKTKYDNGFMTFDRIKRVSSDTLYVSDGTYTTCSLDENPHYYFSGKKMKFILNDKLIIKPITAYIMNIPVLWFPFYVFPITKGRQSGFLTPRYGSSRQDGRYLSNIGYYYVPSDYWDYQASAVVRERNGWLLKNWVSYNSRYSMNGSVFGSFENQSRLGTRQWIFRASHSQEVTPTLQILGDANFQSSNYSQLNSYNVYERLNRDARSSLSVTKRWKESGNSLTSNFSHDMNLDTKNTTSVLPSLRFRKPRALLFGTEKKESQQRKYEKKSVKDETEEKSWYKSIYYTFDADFQNTLNKTESDDTLESETTFNRAMGMSTSVSSSNKFMGWLVTEPSLNVKENFIATSADSISRKYQRKDNIYLGLSAGTTVYGMFEPKIGNVVGLRHVISPSISYSLGKNRQYYASDPRALYRFDRNIAQKNLVNNVSLNLRNIFQVKTVKGEKENKFDLFTLNFSTALDFEADEKLSPLQTTLDFKPTKFVTTRLSSLHSFYHKDERLHLLSPNLDNFSITTDVGITQQDLFFIGDSSRPSANNSVGRDDIDIANVVPEDEKGSGIKSEALVPFNLRFSHFFGVIRNTYGTKKYTVTHNIKPDISFSPSANTSVSYSLYFDFQSKEIISQRLLLKRDLHCFEANLSWVPSGIQEGFYFKVNIKDLPDVKVEKRRGSSQLRY
ncbi:MAG: putative LPS assembly protein LptD [Candidatus Latescibacterota bacterium]